MGLAVTRADIADSALIYLFEGLDDAVKRVEGATDGNELVERAHRVDVRALDVALQDVRAGCLAAHRTVGELVQRGSFADELRWVVYAPELKLGDLDWLATRRIVQGGDADDALCVDLNVARAERQLDDQQIEAARVGAAIEDWPWSEPRVASLSRAVRVAAIHDAARPLLVTSIANVSDRGGLVGFGAPIAFCQTTAKLRTMTSGVGISVAVGVHVTAGVAVAVTVIVAAGVAVIVGVMAGVGVGLGGAGAVTCWLITCRTPPATVR